MANNQYTVIFRKGGWANARWCCILDAGDKGHMEQVQRDLTRSGYKARVWPVAWVENRGLPVGFCHHVNADGNYPNDQKTCACD